MIRGFARLEENAKQITIGEDLDDIPIESHDPMECRVLRFHSRLADFCPANRGRMVSQNLLYFYRTVVADGASISLIAVLLNVVVLVLAVVVVLAVPL